MIFHIERVYLVFLKNVFPKLADETDTVAWRLVGFVVVLASLPFLLLGVVRLDLLLHSWVRDLPFRWWYVFTTPHGFTLIWLRYNDLWWALVIVFAFFLGLAVATAKKKESYS